MDENMLREIIADTEDEHTERKSATTNFDRDKLYSYIAALANEGGGNLLMGVNNDGTIIGTQTYRNPTSLKQEILSNGSMSRRLRVQIFEEVIDGKRVVLFKIPARPRGEAISYKGSYYMRSGESLVPMNFDTITAISSESTSDFSAEIVENLSVSDLEDAAIEKARELWLAKSGSTRINSMTRAELLAGLELADERGVTYAALLLLGNENIIKRFAPNCELVWEFRKHASDIEFVARKEYKQPFVMYFDALWEQVDSRNDVAHIREGFLVRDISAFSESVVREAVLNAVAHRDYQDPGSVYVRQSPEQLVIESPGGFVNGVTPANIIEISSRPRNRRIAEAFQKLGLVERSGQGADKIFLETIAAGKGLPDYSSSSNSEVKLVVNAQIQDMDFIKFLDKVASETNIVLTAQDYVVLEQVRQGILSSMSDDKSLNRLLELGLIEKMRRGRNNKPILSKRYYVAFNKRGEYTRQKGLGKSANLEIILKHLEIHGKGYARDIEQALPHVTRASINRYLKELSVSERIELVGNRNAPSGKDRAYWRLKR
jgi:ATP-dependent DNA helicase RecG